MSQGSLGTAGAIVAIIVATAVNNLVKTTASGYVGGAGIGLRVGLPLAAASTAGLGIVWLNTPYPDMMSFISDIVSSEAIPTD
jgi:hypothetical protein